MASRAREIVLAEGGTPELAEEAFTAGILHDVGKLVFAQCCPDRYGTIETGADSHRAERSAFDATHTEVGAYLLGLWGLPDALVEAVAGHHNAEVEVSPLLDAVRRADAQFYAANGGLQQAA